MSSNGSNVRTVTFDSDGSGSSHVRVVSPDNVTEKGSWEPYVGPQDGFGWRNPDTDEVVYQDEPPGEMDLSDFTDGQISALEEALGTTLSDSSDSPERETGDLRESYVDQIEENIDVEERSPTAMLTSREVKNEMAFVMDRAKNPELANNTINNMDEIANDSTGGSYWNSRNGKMNLSSQAPQSTVAHELGHAMTSANGFDTSNMASVMSITFSRSDGVDVDKFDMSKGEIIDEFIEKGKLSESHKDKIDQNFDLDSQLEPEELTFSLRDDFDGEVDEDLQNVVSKVNDAFVESINTLRDGGDVKTMKDEYEFTNANEFWAAIHENLQQDGINYRNMKNMYDQYPDVLDAYFDVFEPNDLQKEEFNYLFNEFGSSGSIDSEPFPEVNND